MKTFIHRHGKRWIAVIYFEGQSMEVCPMIGKPYLTTKMKQFIGSTRAKVEQELNDYLNALVNTP